MTQKVLVHGGSCFVQDMPFVVNEAKTIVVNLDACRVREISGP